MASWFDKLVSDFGTGVKKAGRMRMIILLAPKALCVLVLWGLVLLVVDQAQRNL
jgi:hypothetical protein